jgi:glycosyltransferase involved in cell wall biosynthesis
MSGPRFSVIIPTRNRASTLRYALQTCTDQDFDSFEIIVSDNDSEDDTRAVVESAGSKCVRYLHTGRALSMTLNWDFAVSQARGEYILLIGDDDGLLPHALRELELAIRNAPAPVVRWERVFYYWPSLPLPWLVNILSIPLPRENTVLDSAPTMEQVVNDRAPYGLLPMLYNAAIPRTMIEEVRARTGGVLRDVSPDIYSGFVFASLAGRYASLARPISIGGGSGASNGMANVAFKGRTAVADEFRRLNLEAGIRWHPSIPDLPVLPSYVAESFATARDVLFPGGGSVRLDRRAIALSILRAYSADDAAEFASVAAEVKRAYAGDAEVTEAIDAEHYAKRTPVNERPQGFSQGQLHLDCADFEVRDVYAAGRLCEKVLGPPSAEAFVWRDSTERKPTLARRIRSAARVLIKGR